MTISGSARRGGCGLALRGTLLRAPLAVEHVGARDLVVAAAHQAELDLVLHVLDVERAAARARAQQRAHDRSVSPSTVSRTLADAAPCVPCDREERLHQRDRDLVRLERDDRAVAAQIWNVASRALGGSESAAMTETEAANDAAAVDSCGSSQRAVVVFEIDARETEPRRPREGGPPLPETF